MASVRSIAVFMLPALAAGATLHSEQSSLMRQEKQVQLTAGGEMLLMQGASKEMLRGDVDYSCYAFIEGTAGQSSCPAGTQIKEVLTSDAISCRAAALRECPDGSCLRNGLLGAMKLLGIDNANDAAEDYDAYPLHCFKGEDGKYGYNPGSIEPTNAKGTPICHHPNFINGSASTLQASDCGIPGYQHVLTEEECGTVWRCLDDSPDMANFRIFNYETRPEGCHVAPDGLVQFNNKTTGMPAGPQGPIADGAYELCHWKGLATAPVPAPAPTPA